MGGRLGNFSSTKVVISADSNDGANIFLLAQSLEKLLQKCHAIFCSSGVIPVGLDLILMKKIFNVIFEYMIPTIL